MKKFALAALAAATLALAGCANEADIASQNISQAADNFGINRRVVFYNGITNEYILSVEGLCAVDASNLKKIMVTCKTGPGIYKKHYLGVSDNVTWFAEQLEDANVSTAHYRVTFKPSVIVPSIDVR